MSDYKTLVAEIANGLKKEGKKITEIKISSGLKNKYDIKLTNSEIRKILLKLELENGFKIESFSTYDNNFEISQIPNDSNKDGMFQNAKFVKKSGRMTRLDKSKFVSIKYVRIKNSYTENIRTNWKTYRNLPDQFSTLVNQKHTTTFEILQNGKNLRFYIDIEKIPIDQDRLIQMICLDLIEFMKEKGLKNELTIDNLAITENTNSTSHEGRSYHVIVPVQMTQNSMKRLLLNFVNDERYNHYIEYIDCSVYSNYRLFRVPNQIGFDKDRNRIEDNIHIPILDIKPYQEYLIQNVNRSIPTFYPINLTTLTLEQKRKAAKLSGTIMKYGVKAALDEKLLASILSKANKPVEPTCDEILELIDKLHQKSNNSNRTINLLDELDEYYEENGNFDNYKFTKQQIKNLLSSLI